MRHDNELPFAQESYDEAINAILEVSFPASDPPSWTLGAAAGGPLRPNRVDNDN